jgi:hypothetical protein
VLTTTAFTATIVMAPGQSSAPIPALTWLLFLGTSVHVASTGWLFALPEVRTHAARKPVRYLWVQAVLVLGGAMTASVFSSSQLAWFLLPYFGWQFFHFQKQNLGLAALAASAEGSPSMNPTERRVLLAAGLAGILGLVAHPGALQLHGFGGAGALFPLAALLFACSTVTGLVMVTRRAKPDRPRGFCAMYTVALLFSLPIFVFGNPYAAIGGMTVAHGLQYLLLVSLVASGTRRSTTRALRIALLVNIALIGGILLGAASHLHSAEPAERLLFGAYLGVVMAHFVIDAGLWRMRDAFPRSLLTRHVPYLMADAGGIQRAQSADRSLADI